MPFGKTKGQGIECKQCLIIVLVEPAKSPGETINTMKFLPLHKYCKRLHLFQKRKTSL